MLHLSCNCGQVRVATSKQPQFVNACNCTLCSKSGARWAYFHPSEVSVKGATKGYSRQDKDEPTVAIQFCPECGSTTHFILTASAIAKFGNVQLGVNVQLANQKDLAGIEMRYPDGLNWSGNGSFDYRQQASIFGE